MVETGLAFVSLLSFENLFLYELRCTSIREHSPYIGSSLQMLDYCIMMPKSVL